MSLSLSASFSLSFATLFLSRRQPSFPPQPRPSADARTAAAAASGRRTVHRQQTGAGNKWQPGHNAEMPVARCSFRRSPFALFLFFPPLLASLFCVYVRAPFFSHIYFLATAGCGADRYVLSKPFVNNKPARLSDPLSSVQRRHPARQTLRQPAPPPLHPLPSVTDQAKTHLFTAPWSKHYL